MRTIEKIKRYSDSEVEEGYRKWIINGCWGKWWINFSKIIKNNLEDFKNTLNYLRILRDCVQSTTLIITSKNDLENLILFLL